MWPTTISRLIEETRMMKYKMGASAIDAMEPTALPDIVAVAAQAQYQASQA